MWSRFVVEIKKFAVIGSFLFFFLGAFATYRRLILAQYQVDYFLYGYSLIESLILAKVVMLGDMLHFGDRFRGKPHIVPVLYRTVVFSLLVFVFTMLEATVRGLFHGLGLTGGVAELRDTTHAIMAAKMLVMFIAFVPMFAIWEIANVVGPGKLFEMFFARGERVDVQLAEQTSVAGR